MSVTTSEGKYSKRTASRQALKRALERLFPAHDFAWRDKPRYTVGKCPWHDDQHPSLSIFPARTTWRFKCHACGKTGDLWTLRREAGEALPTKVAERLERREKLIPALWKAGLVLQGVLLERGCPWLDQKVPGWKAVVEAAQEEGIPVAGLYPAREELERRLEKEGLSLEELSPYLWPVRENGEPWDLEGWLAWFQGRPGEVCRVRVRRPGSRERLVLEALEEGGLVGLQVFLREKRYAKDALLLEGETDWLALQARALEEGQGLVPAAAIGGVSSIERAIQEVLPWVDVESPQGVLYYWPDFDLSPKGSPGLWAGLQFLNACAEEGIFCQVIFPPEYRPGQDPCDYLREFQLIQDDLIPPQEYVQRVIEELLTLVPETDRKERENWLRRRIEEEFGALAKALPPRRENELQVIASQARKLLFDASLKAIAENTAPLPDRLGPLEIPRGIVTLLAGTGGVGKGWTTIWLALQLVQEGINVAMLSLEDPCFVLQYRMQKILSKMPTPGEQKGKLRVLDSVSLEERVGKGIEDKENVIEAIQNLFIEGFDFVIIDPIVGLFEDENDNAKVTKVMTKLNKLVSYYGTNILAVHHTRKWLAGPKKPDALTREDLYESVRGATALVNGVRQVFVVKRNSKLSGTLDIICVKSNVGKIKDFMLLNILEGEHNIILKESAYFGNHLSDDEGEEV